MDWYLPGVSESHLAGPSAFGQGSDSIPPRLTPLLILMSVNFPTICTKTNRLWVSWPSNLPPRRRYQMLRKLLAAIGVMSRQLGLIRYWLLSFFEPIHCHYDDSQQLMPNYNRLLIFCQGVSVTLAPIFPEV